MFLGALEKLELQLIGECFSLLMWPLLVSQLNFDFWHIILADRSIYWPSFHLFWSTLEYNFYSIVMYYNFCKFYIFFHAIPLRNEWSGSFLRHDVSKFSQSIWCSNVENVRKSFRTPTSSRQHNNINLFPYTTTTARPLTAAIEWPMPTSGPTQGKLIDINNPMYPPTATSLQQYPCCLPQQPHGRQWQQDGRVEGEWGEWVEGERETGKVMTMQCATHTLNHL